MAIKKSELYSSLWASCDELRGGMDASQYKDYVLVLLFIKYVSDKYAGQPFAPITIPPGASFADMVALKGSSDIGDQINKRIVGPLAAANKLADMPDFNDASKLGSGKEMVDRLTNLIATFENPALDFSRNRADGDDILGDAYEYLMRHFATESGKSKGQFYTPAEVSRVMARIIGIGGAHTHRLGRCGFLRRSTWRWTPFGCLPSPGCRGSKGSNARCRRRSAKPRATTSTARATTCGASASCCRWWSAMPRPASTASTSASCYPCDRVPRPNAGKNCWMPGTASKSKRPCRRCCKSGKP